MRYTVLDRIIQMQTLAKKIQQLQNERGGFASNHWGSEASDMTSIWKEGDKINCTIFDDNSKSLSV